MVKFQPRIARNNDRRRKPGRFKEFIEIIVIS